MFAYAKSEQKQPHKDTVQKKESVKTLPASNQTGVPDKMKTNFENLSRFSFDDVRVHYNSDKPVQLQTPKCTQGNSKTTNFIGKESGANSPIQFKLGMQLSALLYDFNTQDRRKDYFSQSNLNFIDENHNIVIDVESGMLKQEPEAPDDLIKYEKINFLENPLVETFTPEEGNGRLTDTVTKVSMRDGYESTYDRIPREDNFEEVEVDDSELDDLEEAVFIYREVMFVKDNGNYYYAPNGGEGLRLSHPSLVGGYPYEVDDAGTLILNIDEEFVAINDSGHYGKTDKGVNDQATEELFGDRRTFTNL